MMNSIRTVIVITVLAISLLSNAQAATWPLRLSAAGKYLEYQDGTPFLVVGESAWYLGRQVKTPQKSSPIWTTST